MHLFISFGHILHYRTRYHLTVPENSSQPFNHPWMVPTFLKTVAKLEKDPIWDIKYLREDERIHFLLQNVDLLWCITTWRPRYQGSTAGWESRHLSSSANSILTFYLHKHQIWPSFFLLFHCSHPQKSHIQLILPSKRQTPRVVVQLFLWLKAVVIAQILYREYGYVNMIRTRTCKRCFVEFKCRVRRLSLKQSLQAKHR